MKTDSLTILQAATDMAAKAHAGQFLRGGKTPYISHPFRVAMTVGSIFHCEDGQVIAAALLHDALEKTPLAPEEIEEAFGPRVLALVRVLTKMPGTDYWGCLKAACWEARLIKMADVLDHLDCPPDDLDRRMRKAAKALRLLAISEEKSILTARRVLEESLAAAAIRRGAPAS